MNVTEEGQIVINLLKSNKDWSYYTKTKYYDDCCFLDYTAEILYHNFAKISLEIKGLIFKKPSICFGTTETTKLFSKRENREIKKLFAARLKSIKKQAKEKELDPIKTQLKIFQPTCQNNSEW